LFLAGATMMACAAKLPREVTVKRPLGEAKPFNADGIMLQNLADESAVSIGQHMRDRGLKYMVITFGSQGCAVCMQKARYLQANLVNDSYNLLGSAAKNVVQLVGVITDPPASRRDVLSLVDSEGLSHLEWWDPGHQVMMDYFQPEGKNFSVPLTLMVSQTEILWTVPSWETITGPELINKIASTLGVDANPPPVNPDDPSGELKRPLLAREQGNRFDEVKLTRCSDRSEVGLSALLPSAEFDFRAVVVTKKTCSEDESCREAEASLQSWLADCQVRWSKQCAARIITTDDSICNDQANDNFVGGKEFLSVFKEHFNWSYVPTEVTPGRWKLPDVTGPMTLIFDRAGKLVFSRDGQIKEALVERMNGDQLAQRERGPDFPIWLTEGSVRKAVPRSPKALARPFSQVRQTSKYTLVMFWNTWCGSCFEELDDWHSRGESPYGFCRDKPEFCQVVALETGRSESGLPPSDYLNGLVTGNDDFEGWAKKGWTMPLAVEDLPLQDGRAPLGWYDGWFRATFGSKEPRNVLYDREGKVVGAWLGLPGEHGPEKALQKLFQDEQSRANN
jgi:thiol-disulfide isomerase/thioredoxin